MSLPGRLAPMLAVTGEPFDSDAHLFEVKWDGTRCLAFCESGRLQLQNRRFVELGPRYPDLRGLARLPPGTLLDGEIVVLEAGKPAFTRLLEREQAGSAHRVRQLAARRPATYVAFDLLYADGRSIMDDPLEARRNRLADLAGGLDDPCLAVPEHVVAQGRALFGAAEAAGLEGIVAKRRASPYLPGVRSPAWVKIKVARTETFAIIGFVPRERESAVSALALGVRRQGGWVYKGRVGSGLTEAGRRDLFRRLASSPRLPDPPAGPREVVWKVTGLRGLVRYAEETEGGFLRAPRLQGILPAEG